MNVVVMDPVTHDSKLSTSQALLTNSNIQSFCETWLLASKFKNANYLSREICRILNSIAEFGEGEGFNHGIGEKYYQLFIISLSLEDNILDYNWE